MGSPQPLYHIGDLTPAFKLYYGWTGWPSAGSSLPTRLEAVLPELTGLWEGDGLRLMESSCDSGQCQMTFSVKPHVAAVFFASRVKGRLQHALRSSGLPAHFSRKVAMRTIGENTREDVERYIARQVGKEPLADPEFKRLLAQFTSSDPSVDLSLPSETLSGRYWYNLHVVLVTEERFRSGSPTWLGKIRDQALGIAAKKGHRISRLAVMPDHLHAALRANIEESPQDVALAFQNNLAYALGNVRVWQPTWYAGTFGEYHMGAIRARREQD